jgi:hypothetical protein
MANDIASRQWRLDTPVPYSAGPSSIIWNTNIFVRNIEFTGYTTQASQCVVKDSNGRIVWQGTGSTTLAPVRTGELGWIKGLVLDTLTNGLCVVSIR